MNAWLDERSAWQFASLWAASEFLEIVVAVAIMRQFVRPFLGLGYVTAYAAIFSCASALASTWGRRRRSRR
jgi:hypothetical protein